MNNLILVALVGFVVACAISQTEAIQCYMCNSLTDGDDCNDPFKSGTKQSNCAQCAKAKYKANGASIVARMCNPTKEGSNGCQSGSYQGVSADMCYCDGDLCNASSRVSVSMATSFGVGLFVLLVKKMF